MQDTRTEVRVNDMRRGRRITSGEKRMLLRRILLLGGAAFLLCILQSSFFSRLRPFGGVPDLMLGGVIAVMMLDNKYSAAVLALGGGFFLDCIGSSTPAFSPVFYLAAVALLGLISDKMEIRFASFGALLLPAVILRMIYSFLYIWGMQGGLPHFGDLALTLLSEALVTAIFCLPVFFLIKLCMIPINKMR